MGTGNKVFAICDTETEYAFRFMEYLSRKKNFPFEIRVFTSAERLACFAEDHPVEILLIAGRNMSPVVSRMRVRKIILLSEEKKISGNYPQIYKYQTVSEVLREVQKEYDWNEEAGGLERRSGKVRIIGTFSPAQFSQQMFFSLAGAEFMAEEKTVLYVSLLEFSGFGQIIGRQYEKDMSDLLYLLQSGDKEGKALNLAQTAGNLDFIPPFRNPSDFIDTEEETWENFMEFSESQTRYEVIWMDIGHMIAGCLSFLKICDEIYMPSGQDSLSRVRDLEFSNALRLSDSGEEIRRKIRLVYPPVISVPEYGEGFSDLLKKTGVGIYAARLLSGREEADHL